jgi:NTP pyrophosphatase (non-canonical NTP hydrolase)
MPLVSGKTEVHFNGKYLGTMQTNESDEIVCQQETMVGALAKPGFKLMEEMTPTKANLNHMVIGLAGEVGEIADCIKKFTMHNKALDVDNLKEEIGDLLFYVFGILREFNVSIFECLELNQAKLAERYKNYVYTDVAAIERADKQGE